MRKLWYFGHLMRRADLLEKTLMLVKGWRQKEKGTAEDKMVGWHHWLDGHEFEQVPGDGEGQENLVCCVVDRVAKSWTWLSNWTNVVAMHSRKQTHSEGQCREWSTVYYTGKPKAESPLSQGPRPVYVKILYTLGMPKPTSPNSLKLGWTKEKERYNQS